MLPSLTLAFICGLALGSLVPYFPLSIVLGLIAAVLGSAVLQAHGRATAGISTAHCGCLLMRAFSIGSRASKPLKPGRPRACAGDVRNPYGTDYLARPTDSRSNEHGDQV